MSTLKGHFPLPLIPLSHTFQPLKKKNTSTKSSAPLVSVLEGFHCTPYFCLCVLMFPWYVYVAVCSAGTRVLLASCLPSMQYHYSSQHSGTFSVGVVGVEDVDLSGLDFTYVSHHYSLALSLLLTVCLTVCLSVGLSFCVGVCLFCVTLLLAGVCMCCRCVFVCSRKETNSTHTHLSLSLSLPPSLLSLPPSLPPSLSLPSLPSLLSLPPSLPPSLSLSLDAGPLCIT